MPPLAIVAGAAVVAGVGGAIAGAASGAGNNTFRSSEFGDGDKYDPNKFEYGGAPGGADAAANAYAESAANAQTRKGNTVREVNATRNRGDQDASLGLINDAANGRTPSFAELQMRAGLDSAVASQTSQAASARGAAGLALAQQNAAGNIASLQQQTSAQSAMLRAQEMAQARDAYFKATTERRGQEIGLGTTNAQLENEQRNRNDQMTQGMTQNEIAVRNAQLTAGTNQQGMLQSDHRATDNANSGVNQANADNEWKPITTVVGAASGGAQAYATGASKSDPRSKMAVQSLGHDIDLEDLQRKYATATPVQRKALDAYAANLRAQAALRVDTMANPDVVAYVNKDERQNYEALSRFKFTAGGGKSTPSSAGAKGGGGESGAAAAAGGKAAAPVRQKTREEQLAELEAEIAQRGTAWGAAPVATQAALERSGAMPVQPPQEPMQGALESMAPYQYRYKPGQEDGGATPHVGPMADAMAADPVASSAVTQAPDGMLAIDHAKALKLSMGGLGYLAQKQRDQQAQLDGLMAAQR